MKIVYMQVHVCMCTRIIVYVYGLYLPVGAVATATHSPGDEGRRHTRPEHYRGELSAVTERTKANRAETVRECEGCEINASSKCIGPNLGESVRECEGGDRSAETKRRGPHVGEIVR